MIEKLKALKNDDGMTLKGYKAITYKTGYQVATDGIETTDLLEAVKAIKKFNGNCGIWYSNGIYYIDNSLHVSEKSAALALGKACNQISILRWSDLKLINC